MLFSAIVATVAGLLASSVEASPLHSRQYEYGNTGYNLTAPATNGTLCGNQTYIPSEYNCFPGDMLCPIVNGTVTAACGTKEKYDCYKAAEYNCLNGSLVELPNYNRTTPNHNVTAPTQTYARFAHLKL